LAQISTLELTGSLVDISGHRADEESDMKKAM
jgi:hypothetical protein